MAKTKYAKAVNDEIMEKMSLKNRYALLNLNLGTILNKKEMAFLQKVENFCMKYEKEKNIKHTMDEDMYEWCVDFGKEGYITRGHNFKEICDIDYGDEWGMALDFMRYLAIDQFDTQYAMGAGATVLAINPIYDHHDNVPVRQDALKDLADGSGIGCILITEPERGSDAVHQLTICEEQEDGSFILNGDKIFNTNAPKSKWAVSYATAEQNNGNKMAQFLINTSWDGWECERVYIPWVPKIWLGKEKLNNLKVPKEYVLGGVGKGRDHLFEGLVPERIGIAYGAVSQCWGAVLHAGIYSNMRKQFDQVILNFQGVGFTLMDLWAKTSNISLGMLKFCESYDEKYEKFGGKIPSIIEQAMVASASHFKYQATLLTTEVCYEAANLMGGAGLGDNLLTHDLLGVSRIQEIVGGSRQIQQYVLQMAFRKMFKML
ncbi:MAG: acyl-CoA dehydrogenase family protein [Promethearchaeota archaeon]